MQAARIPSQSYIFVPLLSGQILAFNLGAAWSWPFFFLTHLSGLFLQLYIVFANDLADEKSDQLNQTYNIFSGGSRVLIEGKISRSILKQAAWLMALLSILCGAISSLLLSTWLPLALMGAGVFLLWAYSFRPFQLSYRGGGELLQAIGVGLVLPSYGFSLQQGAWELLPVGIYFAPLFVTQLACAFSTTLPDHPSDLIGRKNTIAVTLGVWPGKFLVLLLQCTAFVWAYSQQRESAATFFLVAGLGLVLMLTALAAKPGQTAMTRFVAGSIVTTLALTLALAMR